MSTTAKIIWAIIIIVIVGGGYWFWTTRESAPSTYAPNTLSNASPSDTSDQALDQDTAAIDAQLNAAASDSSNVGSTINDKPIEQ